MDIINWTIDYIYSWRKYNYYVGTLFAKYFSYNFLHGSWWDKINDNIILGAIPLHNSNHLELLKNENIGAVLSVVEDFELNPSIYFRPITGDEWMKNNINYLHIQVEDSYGVRIDDIKKSIMFISDNVKENKKIYIHCKAGRGRSASIVLCYMLWNIYADTGSISEEQITKTYEELKHIRYEVSISGNQFTTIREYVKSLVDGTKI